MQINTKYNSVTNLNRYNSTQYIVYTTYLGYSTTLNNVKLKYNIVLSKLKIYIFLIF